MLLSATLAKLAVGVIAFLKSAGINRPGAQVADDNPLPAYGPIVLRSDQSIAVTAGAYVAGNAVGALWSFTNMARVAGQGGMLQTATLRDKSGNAGTYDLFLFDSAPTPPTDHSAVALAAADLAKCIGVITFPAVKLGAAATMGISDLNLVGKAYKLAPGGTTLFGILVTRGTPTYASTSDVSLNLEALPD